MKDEAPKKSSEDEIPADEQPDPATDPDKPAPWQEGENPRRYRSYKNNLKRRNDKRPPGKPKRPTLSEKDWWETYGKEEPHNPDGGRGDDDHKEVVEELVKKANEDFPDRTRYRVTSDQPVKGLKQKPDAAVFDTLLKKIVKVYEAARFGKKGGLIRPDERGKIVDYEAAGVPYEFHPVGPNKPRGGDVLTWSPPEPTPPVSPTKP